MPAAEHDELLLLADLTLAEFARHLARFGGTVLEADGLVLFAGAHPQPNPYRNGLVRLDRRLDGGEVMRRAAEFFSTRNRGFVVWARDDGDEDLVAAVTRAGGHALDRLPEMVLDHVPEEGAALPGVEIRRVADADEGWDYLRVVAEAWGFGAMPLEVAARVFFHPDSALAPNAAAFVAYEDGEPLSGTMCLVSHGVALGTQGGTVARARKRGLAQATLRAALRVGFNDLGARLSLCQTSELGAHAWEDVGYVAFGGYRRFLAPSSAGARPSAATTR